MINADVAEYAAAIAFGLVGIVVGLQKVLKGWKSTSAESSVITLMHEELERMSVQNKILSTELASLQIEILNLNKELRKLTTENQKLHTEVVSLTSEVVRLRGLLDTDTSV
jgi:predicted nuclease with TOPRIM domain